MKTIGELEVKTRLASLLEQVAQGETFTITRHGKPVAELVPAHATDRSRRQQAVERLRAFSKGRTLGMDWKELRDAGRRY